MHWKEIEAAAHAMMREMFAPHELPLSEDLEMKYYKTAQEALRAAENVREHLETK